MHRGLVAFLAFNGALLGAFGLLFTPLYYGAIPVPLGAVVSMLTLPWLVRSAGELDPRPLAAASPLAAWTVVVAVLAFVGPGRDVLLPETWQSLLLVVGGLGTGLWALRAVLLDEASWSAPDPTTTSKDVLPHG